MAKIKVETRQEVHDVNYITIDGKEFLLGDVIQVLQALDDTDGIFTFAHVSSPELEEMLRANKAADRDNRGSWYCLIPGYYDLFEQVCKAAGFDNDWWELMDLDEDEFRKWQGRKLQGKHNE